MKHTLGNLIPLNFRTDAVVSLEFNNAFVNELLEVLNIANNVRLVDDVFFKGLGKGHLALVFHHRLYVVGNAFKLILVRVKNLMLRPQERV